MPLIQTNKPIGYLDTETFQYPVAESDIREARPNVSFPVPFVAPTRYAVVFPAPQPAYDSITQAVREIAPVLTDKWHYEQRWEVVSRFSEYTDDQGVVHTVAEQESAARTAALESARTAKNDEINAERERRTFDSFTHAGKTISCDTLSRSDIDGANGYIALNGVFPAIWPGAWKCADNTYLTITTIDEWKAFYNAMVEAGAALYAHAQELKAALALATTAEEIAAIVWAEQ